jgi:hypothetical protein
VVWQEESLKSLRSTRISFGYRNAFKQFRDVVTLHGIYQPRNFRFKRLLLV